MSPSRPRRIAACGAPRSRRSIRASQPQFLLPYERQNPRHRSRPTLTKEGLVMSRSFMDLRPRAGRRGRGRPATWLAAVVAVLVLAAPAAAQEQPTRPTLPPNFAITGARIVPVSGAVIERGTVV